MRISLLLAVAVPLLGCSAASVVSSNTPADPGPPPPPPPAPEQQRPPADPLATDVPLLSGETVDLGRLRGIPRLVYFVAPDASDERLVELARWAADVARGGRNPGPVVVLVAATNAHDRLVDLWGVPSPGVYYGWDPQGAVAARLAVEAFPAVILADTEGHIVLRRSGESAARLAEIGRKARATTGAPDW